MAAALYIGLMSGTSLDGVDAALVDFSGSGPAVLATDFAPFAPALRAELLALQAPCTNELERAALAANGLAESYAGGVASVLKSAGVGRADVRAIGAHGQTVRHRPAAGFTLQLNNPALLAELTGIAVVADFRSRDVAAGGQGAPLAPAFHRAFFAAPGAARAVINIGGIANVTLLAADGGATGFDTGAGNVLMDLWIARHQGVPYDAGGAWAATGVVVPELLQVLLAEPYLALPPPKSTGRDLFNALWLDRALAAGRPRSAADVQATLLEASACSIADALRVHALASAYVCGGGAHNARLMHRLRERMRPVTVEVTDSLGVPADWVEAVGFAWLAERHIGGHAIDLAAVTGAAGARMAGALYPN